MPQGEAPQFAAPSWFGRVVLDVWRAQRFRAANPGTPPGEAGQTGGVAPDQTPDVGYAELEIEKGLDDGGQDQTSCGGRKPPPVGNPRSSFQPKGQ